jgi:hypothetical protein
VENRLYIFIHNKWLCFLRVLQTIFSTFLTQTSGISWAFKNLSVELDFSFSEYFVALTTIFNVNVYFTILLHIMFSFSLMNAWFQWSSFLKVNKTANERKF